MALARVFTSGLGSRVSHGVVVVVVVVVVLCVP